MSFQIEGEALKGGRGPSIWDTFTRQHPGLPPAIKINYCNQKRRKKNYL